MALPSCFRPARQFARTVWRRLLGLAARGTDRDSDAYQGDDRTQDRPGGGVAHRAALDRTEALQREQQTEQRHHYTDNHEGNTHVFNVGRWSLQFAMMEATRFARRLSVSTAPQQ